MAPDAQHESPTTDDLRGSLLFDGFADDDLERVAELGRIVDFEPGAMLTDQGRVGLDCFVLLAGSACVYVGDVHVATVGPGSAVGEMSLLDHRPRTATVVADSAIRAVSFDLEHFRRLIDELPEAKARLEAVLAERTRRLDDVRTAQKERRL